MRNNPSMNPRRRLVGTNDAADAVNIHPVTLRRWVREGAVRPTSRTAGGHARWDVDDLQRQLDERARQHDPAPREPAVPPLERLRRQSPPAPAHEGDAPMPMWDDDELRPSR
jgi:hypothetical protein